MVRHWEIGPLHVEERFQELLLIGASNRSFLFMEGKPPIFMPERTSERYKMPPNFACLELVLYGIRELVSATT